MEHGVEEDEDEQDGDGQDEHEAARGALLALVFAGPVDLVAGGQLDLVVDGADGFFDGGAEVAVADGVLDGDVALAGFAIDLFGAVFGPDVGELREGDALAGGSGEADVVDGLFGGAVLGQIADDDVVARFLVEDLRDGAAADRGLDGVLNVGDVDAVAGGGFAVDGVVEIGLADDAEEAEVLHAADVAHDADDLVALFFEGLEVVAVELDGELAFDAGDGLFDVVGDGLGEAPEDAGGFVELAVSMAAMSSSLFCLKTGRQSALGLRSTKYSVLKKPVVSVPSSGRPVWETTLRTSGKAARRSRASFMTRRLSVGPVEGARVPRTQMEPSSRWGRNSEPMAPEKPRKRATPMASAGDAEGDGAVLDGPGERRGGSGW